MSATQISAKHVSSYTQEIRKFRSEIVSFCVINTYEFVSVKNLLKKLNSYFVCRHCPTSALANGLEMTFIDMTVTFLRCCTDLT